MIKKLEEEKSFHLLFKFSGPYLLLLKLSLCRRNFIFKNLRELSQLQERFAPQLNIHKMSARYQPHVTYLSNISAKFQPNLSNISVLPEPVIETPTFLRSYFINV
jgi:hypothetical protein